MPMRIRDSVLPDNNDVTEATGSEQCNVQDCFSVSFITEP